MLKKEIKVGIVGKLEDITTCSTGSIKLHVKRNDGRITTPLMTTKFPELPQIKKKAEALKGKLVRTYVSTTTDDWAAGKFFCDLDAI